MNNNFIAEIESDLNWRESELATLKKQLMSFQKDTNPYWTFLRALICILYAHFEGFSKFVWTLYLDEIQKSLIQRKYLIEELLLYSLEKDFNKLRE